MKKLLFATILIRHRVRHGRCRRPGGDWAPVVPEAGDTAGCAPRGRSPPGRFALMVGPSATARELIFDGVVVERSVVGGVSEYRGLPLPSTSTAASHVLSVRLQQSGITASAPVLEIVPEDGLSSRLSLLNIPLAPDPRLYRAVLPSPGRCNFSPSILRHRRVIRLSWLPRSGKRRGGARVRDTSTSFLSADLAMKIGIGASFITFALLVHSTLDLLKNRSVA